VVLEHGVVKVRVGRCSAGTYSFNNGGAHSFEIVVENNAAPGWHGGVTNQLSSNTNASVQFVHTRGVCVNRNPISPNFGRIYVSVALPGSTVGRDLGEGIFILDPRLTGVSGLGDGAKTGGLDFAEPDDNALSPFRLSVGPDDTLYICDLSTSTGTLYATDPNVNVGINVFGLKIGGEFPVTTNRIHGSISAVYAEGSPATTNLTLWVIDEDLQMDRQNGSSVQRNSIWRWDLQAEPFPASNAPPVRLTGSPLNGLAPQLADLARGPDGKFYVSQRRGASFGLPGATTPGLFVVASDGSAAIWNSLSASRAVLQNPSATDILTDTGAIDVSYDGKYIAVLRTNNSVIQVLPLVNGLPDLTNRIQLITSTNGPAEDIAFDAANNIYYVSSGQRLLRVLSGGGYTKATTRSDGTFDLIEGNFEITGSSASDSAIEIDFTFTALAMPSDFKVDSAPAIAGAGWAQEQDASIVVRGSGFRATVPLNGEMRFYRLRRLVGEEDTATVQLSP
jgi:hypothetical protein